MFMHRRDWGECPLSLSSEEPGTVSPTPRVRGGGIFLGSGERDRLADKRRIQQPATHPQAWLHTVSGVALYMVSALEGEAGQPGLGAGRVLTEGAQIGAVYLGHRPPRVTFPPAPQFGEPVAHLPVSADDPLPGQRRELGALRAEDPGDRPGRSPHHTASFFPSGPVLTAAAATAPRAGGACITAPAISRSRVGSTQVRPYDLTQADTWRFPCHSAADVTGTPHP
jgi:hypothetical protein